MKINKKKKTLLILAEANVKDICLTQFTSDKNTKTAELQ